MPQPLRDDATSEPELQCLYRSCQETLLRFTDQKMDVLRHHNVAAHNQLVTPSHLLQDAKKQIPANRTTQVGFAMVTAKGDEVLIVSTVPTFQTRGHMESLRES